MVFAAIGSGLLFRTLLLQCVDDLLGILAGFIQKRHILRKADLKRCTGRIHDQRTAVAATVSRRRRVIIVVNIFIILFLMRLLPRFCIPNDHLIDLAQDLRRQPLAEVHHERWIKGQFLVIVSGIAQKY